MGKNVVAQAAARAGGILANDSRPTEFIYENLAIESNVIGSAWWRSCEVEAPASGSINFASLDLTVLD